MTSGEEMQRKYLREIDRVKKACKARGDTDCARKAVRSALCLTRSQPRSGLTCVCPRGWRAARGEVCWKPGKKHSRKKICSPAKPCRRAY